MEIKKTLLMLLAAGIMFLAPKIAKAATLNQWVYPDSSIVTIYNKTHTDSITALVGQFLKNYWSKTLPAGWGVNIGDSGTVRIKSPTNDISNIKWFCTAASDLLPTAFAGKYSISVRDASNGADTVTTKCYKKGGLDTLIGVFDITTSSFAYEVYFDVSSLGLNNGDSVFIDAYAPGEHGQTKGVVQHRFIDADTLASFNLVVGIPEEQKQKKALEYQVYPTITKGKVNVKGLEKGFDVFNVAGQLIEDYQINSTGSYEFNYPDGTYFIMPKDKTYPTKKVVKTK